MEWSAQTSSLIQRKLARIIIHLPYFYLSSHWLMNRLILIGRLLITISSTSWYVLLPLSHSYRLAQDIDTTQFPSLRDVQEQRWETLFLTRWSNLLLHPLIRDDLYHLWQGLQHKLWPQSVRIFSIYRSIATQANLKARRVWTPEDRFTAYPWASEHHLGTTIDLEFVRGHRAGVQWLKTNAYRYWFIQSLPAHCESITRIPQEDRHRRWIGRDLASLFWTASSGNTQLCLQTFLERLDEFDVIIPEKMWSLERRDARHLGLSDHEIRQMSSISCDTSWYKTQKQCDKQTWLITLWPLLLPPTSQLVRMDSGRHLIEDRWRYWVSLGRLTPFRRDPSRYHTPSTALLFATTPRPSTRQTTPRQEQWATLRLW